MKEESTASSFTGKKTKNTLPAAGDGDALRHLTSGHGGERWWALRVTSAGGSTADWLPTSVQSVLIGEHCSQKSEREIYSSVLFFLACSDVACAFAARGIYVHDCNHCTAVHDRSSHAVVVPVLALKKNWLATGWMVANSSRDRKTRDVILGWRHSNAVRWRRAGVLDPEHSEAIVVPAPAPVSPQKTAESS